MEVASLSEIGGKERKASERMSIRDFYTVGKDREQSEHKKSKSNHRSSIGPKQALVDLGPLGLPGTWAIVKLSTLYLPYSSTILLYQVEWLREPGKACSDSESTACTTRAH